MKKNIHIMISLLFFLITQILSAQMHISSAIDVMQLAEQRSEEYRLAKLYAENEYKIACMSIQDFLPTSNFSWTEDDTIKIANHDSRNKSILFSLRQTLLDGGKRKLSYSMNKINAYYALKNYEQEFHAFKSQAISYYYSCLQQQELVKIKNELVNNARLELEIIKKEFTLGLALENDYLEYLLLFKKLEDEKYKAEKSFEDSIRKLKFILNIALQSKIIVSNENDFTEAKIRLENHFEKLWSIAEKNNPAIKQAELSALFAKKNYEQSKRIFIPELSLETNLSFSGISYPLSNPSFSVKLAVSFANNPFFPISVNSGYKFEHGKLSGINNVTSIVASPDLTLIAKKRSEQINISKQNELIKQQKNSLFENLSEKININDSLLSTYSRTKERIELLERKLTITKEMVELGEAKRGEYLDALVELAEEKISLSACENNIYENCRALEILLCIPYGGLENCI